MPNVYAFHPRKVDPPQFVAEDVEYLDSMVGGFISGEQCDGCGNSSYRVETAHGKYSAVCEVPLYSHEFQHPAPCGCRYAITTYDDSEVTF
jgi:hypothetical protein